MSLMFQLMLLLQVFLCIMEQLEGYGGLEILDWSHFLTLRYITFDLGCYFSFKYFGPPIPPPPPKKKKKFTSFSFCFPLPYLYLYFLICMHRFCVIVRILVDDFLSLSSSYIQLVIFSSNISISIITLNVICTGTSVDPGE